MDDDLAVLDRHRGHSARQYRLRRFSFRSGINTNAQRVLADLARQLTLQLDGVEACEMAFDRTSNQWVEYTVRTDGCPIGEAIAPGAARAVLARLRAAERGEDHLAPCPPAADARQTDAPGFAEKCDRVGNG